MYKQVMIKGVVSSELIQRTTDMNYIPFDILNRDYIRFKREINEETEQLQDADGNVMTAQEAKQYIATLP